MQSTLIERDEERNVLGVRGTLLRRIVRPDAVGRGREAILDDVGDAGLGFLGLVWIAVGIEWNGFALSAC